MQHISMNQTELLPHLFRTEFSKITAVLCKLFGLKHIEIAEDIAGDTFLAAAENWSYNGIPPNPTAWLYSVAKNKTLTYLKRNQLFSEIPTSQKELLTENFAEIEIDLSPQNITDSQLQMLFAVCHPSISAESQIGLALRILCGFGIDEIATALLSNKETISKRLETVLTTLYLLFSEGYYSESQDSVIREDLCYEAMRLTHLLLENKFTNKTQVNAFYSLMCFHSSRFKARKNNSGELVLYQDQDEALWDQNLISKGAYYLHIASQGKEISH